MKKIILLLAICSISITSFAQNESSRNDSIYGLEVSIYDNVVNLSFYSTCDVDSILNISVGSYDGTTEDWNVSSYWGMIFGTEWLNPYYPGNINIEHVNENVIKIIISDIELNEFYRDKKYRLFVNIRYGSSFMTAKDSNTLYYYPPFDEIDVEITSDFFTWQSVEGATGYQLIIYNDAARTNILLIINFDENGRYISTQQPAKPRFAVAEADGYSYPITDLENDTYYFTLTAFENEEIIAQQEGSFEINETTALPAVEKSNIDIYVSEKNIVIENAQGATIQVFNTVGQTLANVQTDSEVVQIPVRKAGIYLVKVGLETVKVAVE